MFQNYRMLLTSAAALAAAGTVAVTGVTAASAAPAPPAAAGAAGMQNFQIMSTSGTARTAKVIASGVFTASGTDVMGSKVDRLVFKGGSFKVRHSAGKGPQSVNRKTCLFTSNQHGTYTIFGGTGSLKGISGHGTYRVSILAVLARNSHGKCSFGPAPLGFQQLIRATGSART